MNEFVVFYCINFVIVVKGVVMFIDKGVFYKCCGIGMFVVDGVRNLFLGECCVVFVDCYIDLFFVEVCMFGFGVEDFVDLFWQCVVQIFILEGKNFV